MSPISREEFDEGVIDPIKALARSVAKGLCCSWCASGLDYCRTDELPKITATIFAALVEAREQDTQDCQCVFGSDCCLRQAAIRRGDA